MSFQASGIFLFVQLLDLIEFVGVSLSLDLFLCGFVFLQLYELHRVYRIQREMMNEVCREERSNVIQAGGFGSSICSSQLLLNDDKARSNVSNSHDMELNYGRLSMSSSVKENTVQSGYYVSGNGLGFKDCEPLESSGSKRPRRRLFDLELPGDAYNDGEVGSGVSGDTRSLFSCTKTMNGSHSLNEPVKMKELSSSASVEVFGDFFCSKDEMGRRVQSSNSHSDFPCLASRFSQESHKGNYGGLLVRNNIEAGKGSYSTLSFDYILCCCCVIQLDSVS